MLLSIFLSIALANTNWITKWTIFISFSSDAFVWNYSFADLRVCFCLPNVLVYWLTSSIILIQAGTQCRHLHLSHCRALWVTIFSITNHSCAIVTDAQVQSELSANTHTHTHQTLSCGLLGHLVVLWAPLSSHNCPTWSSSPFLLSLLQTSCDHQSRKPKRSEWESWPKTLTSKIQ